MANLKNLKPFPKGKSGNPKGRPALPDLKEALIEALNNGELEKILFAIIDKAKKGDTRAAQLILDRAFGQAKQIIEQETKQDLQPIIRIIQGNAPPQARDESEIDLSRQEY